MEVTKLNAPHGGITPQGQLVAETPPDIMPAARGSYNLSSLLVDAGMRYGKLFPGSQVPMTTKLEMLRDHVIQYCQGFVTASLLRATRTITCADENKRRFFEAMLRGTPGWEREYILQASMAIPLGGVGLIKRFEFATPKPKEVNADPVWTSEAVPYIISKFEQVHPSDATPDFDATGHFNGIDSGRGHIDPFFSLWVTVGRHMAFGAYDGWGRLESAYWSWWIGSFVGDQFVTFLQKNIDRIPVVGYPPKKDDSNVDVNQRTALRIGNLARSGATLAIPTTTYQVVDPATGEQSLTAQRRWTMDFLNGSGTAGDFIMMFDAFDSRKALGYLVPPQGFLKVGGGDLGGPTTADVLMEVTEETLLTEAHELDEALNKYVFPVIEKTNFPPDSPPVRIETVSLSQDNRAQLLEIVKTLIGRPDVPPTVFGLSEAFDRLKLPKGESLAKGELPAQEPAPAAPAGQGEGEQPAGQEPEGETVAQSDSNEPGGAISAANEGAATGGKAASRRRRAKGPTSAPVAAPASAPTAPPAAPASLIAELTARGFAPADVDEGEGGVDGDSPKVTMTDIETMIRRMKETEPELFE